MYEKIVVPLDGSENSESSLSYAEGLARLFGSELDFIGVGSDQERPFEHLFHKHIENVAREFKDRGLNSRAVFTYGHPADEILKYSNEVNPSLIVMATHGRSGFAEWTVGGVAEKVLLHAPMPVLLIPRKHPGARQAAPAKFERILLPLAGSSPGPTALPWAKELAKRAKAKIFLLHVLLSTSNVVGVLNYALGFERQLIAVLRQQAQEYVDNIAEELTREGIEFQRDLVTGIPSDAILEFASRNAINLIAMSTRGRVGASRIILGSVTHQIVHTTEIPVLAVRPQQRP